MNPVKIAQSSIPGTVSGGIWPLSAVNINLIKFNLGFAYAPLHIHSWVLSPTSPLASDLHFCTVAPHF